MAREFLILVGCGIAFSLFYLGTFVYNGILTYQVGNLQTKINLLKTKSDSLTSVISFKEAKQKWFYNEHLTRHGADLNYSSYQDLWQRLEYIQKSDSIISKWNHTWSQESTDFLKELGFSNGPDFNQFIIKYSLDISDWHNQDQADSILMEISHIERNRLAKASSKISSGRRIPFAIDCLVIVILIAFPARYLYFLVKWSHRTLKRQE